MATTNVLILGATGSIARIATQQFLEHDAVHLTLYERAPTGSQRDRAPRSCTATSSIRKRSLQR